MNKIIEEHISVKEAAEALKISESTVYRYIEEGHLPAYKMPGSKGRLMIMKSDFEKFVSGCRV
jgi:excisionase family DNA binding protein